MPRSSWWGVGVLLLLCLFACTSQSDQAVVEADELASAAPDLVITEDWDDPLRAECIASIEDSPHRSRIRTDAEYEARVQYCIAQYEALNQR